MESEEQYLRRKLDKDKGRIEDIRGKYETFDTLVNVAGDELEMAEAAYMELGDTEEAWISFNEHCERACFNLRCSIETLNKLAETEPSMVDQKTWKWLDDAIKEIGNIRIKFWKRWTKPMLKEREIVQRPTGKPTCPEQVLNSITDMRTPEAVEFCLRRCERQIQCDSEAK